MKSLLTKTSLILLIALAFSVNAWAQSNPTPFNLSGGDYSFTTWNNTSTAGTYPANMILHTTPTLDVPISGVFDKDWTAAYNLSSAARFNGAGTNGLYFLNTGSTNSGQGFIGEIVLALNTTNRTQTTLSFIGGFVNIAGTSSRQYALRAQYRLGTTGAWTDIVDGSNNPVEYKNTQYLTDGSSTPAHNTNFSNVLLPSVTDNQPVVQIRWIYYQIGTGSGNRPTYRLDDIAVTSQSLFGTPTQLVVSGLTPANPVTNVPFTLTIRAVDEYGVPKYVASNTDVRVLLYWGNGTLAGTTTKTMAAGTNVISFNDLKYNVAEGMQVKFQAISGVALDSGKHNIYVKTGPTNAKFFDVYTKGYTGVVNHTFTVRALNADGNPNEYYDFYPITLNLLSGPGTIGGTTTQIAMNGIATFNDITFSAAGTYVFSAIVPGLANPQSVTVTVKDVPAFAELIIPSHIKGDGSFLPTGNGRAPQFALVSFSGLHPNTEYTYVTSGMLAADVPTTYFGAGNNLYYDYKTNTYSYTSNATSLSNSAERSTFKTGASETTKQIWVNLVPTTNSKFNVGNQVVWCVYLANEFGDQISRNTTVQTSLSARFGTGTNDVTGLYDKNSRLNPKNYVVFYDMNGKALSAALIQDEGATLTTVGFPHQAPAFYANLDYSNGAWATFVPNNLGGGIRSISEYTVNGVKVFDWTDDDAIWAGVNTINPNKGSNGLAFETPFVEFTNLDSYSNICNTGSFDFMWDYNGVETLSIQVSLDNGDTWETIVAGYPASEGKFNWMIQRVSFADKYLMFRIFSDEHPYIVDQADGVMIFDTPQIDNYSKSEVYCKGSEVTIEVIATGSNILYQWYKDGIIMPGQNLPYLYFKTIDYNNTGVYHCVISGSAASGCNSVQTGDIVVYIARPTSIAKQPQSMFINLGGSAFFEIDPAANGIPTTYKYYYQWYSDGTAMKDDARIQGTQGRILTFNSVIFSDLAKKYTCRVTALCGIAYSDTVRLTQSEISIVTQPKDKRLCEGEDVVLDVAVQNNKNLEVKYYWMKGSYRVTNDARISGANTTTLTITDVKESDMGNYQLVVEIAGKEYKLYSNGAYVYVVTIPVITFQTPNQNLVEDDELELEIKSKSTTTVQNVSWKKDDVLLPEYTTTKLYKQFVETGDAGSYVCTIQNECGTVVSDPIIVKVAAKGISSVEEIVAGEVILNQPVPNPTSEYTQFDYVLPAQSQVTISITDMFGKSVASFDQKTLTEGTYKFEVNVSELNIPSGIYFINVSTKFGVSTQKLIVLE